MIKPNIHANEKERLQFLDSYSIIDSLPETDYDNLTAIASEICKTPISLVSLLDNNRQWFKSHHGLNVSETDKDIAFCAHAINQDETLFIVPDARKDERFHDNPLVKGEPNIVFYAGVVLKNKKNLPLGTLCVIDDKPNSLNESQIKSLKALGNQVMNLLELRKNKMLLESKIKEVEENNIELERFANIAAHDLKSPLNNIYSLIEILADDYSSKLDVGGQEIIELIKKSSEKLNELIDGLLKYSKYTKLINEEKSEIELTNLVSDISSHFSHDNKCIISLKTNLSSICVNQIAIEQILINLVANANKYSDKEITEIEIQVSENEKHYEIKVKDNGPGIDSKYQKRIFEIFEILVTEDRYGKKGNGIGLAVVKKIVEKLGGEIKVDSELGKGASFNFSLAK